MLFDFERPEEWNGQREKPTTRRNAYEMNYERLENLLGQPLKDLKVGYYFRLISSGYMDLVVEVIDRCSSTNAPMVSLAHYYELNGDLCQDPDVVIRAIPPGRGCRHVPSSRDSDGKPEHGRVEALTFQQAIPPVYSEAYDWSSGKPVARPRTRKSINSFLSLWLKNLQAQGHQVSQFKKS